MHAARYSACEWPAEKGITTLEKAEAYTVRRYQDTVGLSRLPEGSRVLELGCGWGSLSLANAKRFPHLQFVSFSNSPPQIEFIRRTAKERGLTNLTVSVEDYALFVNPSKSAVAPAGSELFDAAMAIETIEHAQNIRELLSAVALRLRPGAKLFVHSLLHQSASYFMDSSSWMGRNFFTGGSIIALNSYFHLAPPELYLRDVIPVSGKVIHSKLWKEEVHCHHFLLQHVVSLFYLTV
jgi:cyclopropane-fatty-acyl-phospholipid synthase